MPRPMPPSGSRGSRTTQPRISPTWRLSAPPISLPSRPTSSRLWLRSAPTRGQLRQISTQPSWRSMRDWPQLWPHSAPDNSPSTTRSGGRGPRFFISGLIDRAPRPRAHGSRRVPGRRLLPGAPAAPEAHRLGLLPSGPDPVHGAPLRRDPALNTTCPALDPSTGGPSDGDSAPHIEGFGFRAPLAPRLARSLRCYRQPGGCGRARITCGAPLP